MCGQYLHLHWNICVMFVICGATRMMRQASVLMIGYCMCAWVLIVTNTVLW